MSAYLVTDYGTALLAAALNRYGYTHRAPVDLARILRKENNRALRARYGDAPVSLGNDSVVADLIQGVEAELRLSEDPAKPTRTLAPLTASRLASLAQEFRYQCAEFDGWQEQTGCALLAHFLAHIGWDRSRTAHAVHIRTANLTA